MSRSQNIGDALVLSKEHPDSSLSDDGCSSGSTTSQGRVVLKKGPWTSAEDALLIQYVKEYGEGNWNAVQKESRLLRCGKSCRLRWANHLRPHLKKGTFSQEEEQLIINMHLQMGNKWAQMAANLPGRTDNEIKNYWNTRVKRRQRAGLPIYPMLNTQASNENQPVHNTSELSSGDQQDNGVLPLDMHAIPEFQFDSYEANPRPLSYAPTPLPNITITSIPIHIGSHTSCLNPGGNHIKQAMISDNSFPGFHFSFPNLISDPIYLNPNHNPRNKNLASFSCSVPSNSGPSNYNFSSSRPFPGTVKMELPSLQFPETGYIDWNNPTSFTSSFDVDAYLQSPIDVSAQAECVSSRNNGLLGDLIHESHAISSGKKRSFEEFSGNVATHADTDPKSPFCLSAVSLFNECNPITSSSYLDEFSSFGACSGSEETMPSAEQVPALHEPVKDALNIPDLLRPDALLGSDWFLGNIGDSSLDIAVPALREEQAPAPSGTLSVVSLSSHPWTSMPRAFQISEQ